VAAGAEVEPQLHRDAALQQEQRLVVDVADGVEHRGDDQVRDGPLQADDGQT